MIEKQKEQLKQYYLNVGFVYLGLAFVSSMFLMLIGNRNNVFESLELLSLSFSLIFGLFGLSYLSCGGSIC